MRVPLSPAGRRKKRKPRFSRTRSWFPSPARNLPAGDRVLPAAPEGEGACQRPRSVSEGWRRRLMLLSAASAPAPCAGRQVLGRDTPRTAGPGRAA